MASMDYDLDSSGGLMPKIQALIAPPESDEISKSNKRKEGLDLHPYYKRPGKGHNRDCCDACSEGGNLICCDKCPASFHLACHDPPLEDEDIPLGQWLCHECRMSAGLPPVKELLKKAMEKATTDASPKEEPPSDTPTRGRSRTSSTASLESNKSRGRGRPPAAAATQPIGPITTASVGAGPDSQSALETLIAAASSMNPTQFDLPREMILPINFPGTDRAPSSQRGKKAAASKRSRTHELDNGLVPLPAKTCFECRKSCKRAPLLACDYCPLLFHLDCLDPPLTSLPCGRWMCPNHVEQAIDERLLTSLSVTQRVALWDKYTGPIDHDAVKTEFLQKARRHNPPFRFKVKLAPRNRAKVPNSVKEMYKNRPPLIPTLREVLRENEVVNRWVQDNGSSKEKPNTFGQKENNLRQDGPTETEQEEWLSGIVALQTSIASHLGSKKRKNFEARDVDENPHFKLKSEIINEEDGDGVKSKILMENETFGEELNNSLKSHCNGVADHCENSSLDNEDVEISKHSKTIGFNGTTAYSKATLENSKILNGDSDTMVEMDSNLQTTAGTEEKKQKRRRRGTETTQHGDLSKLLEETLDSYVPDTDIDKLDEGLIRLLALQRLQQLTSIDRPLPTCFSTSKAQTAVVQKQTTFWPSPESGLKPRALLTPLSGSQPPMPIYYRVMEIGTGGDMDICLTYYGHCNYVTAKHAVIICDEVNKHYELMNYSEHGTTVDNVLYSCDFSEKTPPKEQPLSPVSNTQHYGRRSGGNSSIVSSAGSIGEPAEAEVEIPPLIQKIRAVVDRRRGVVREEDNVPEPSKMPSDIGKVDMKCSCRSSSSSLIGGSGAGWEGTALLNHGSLIKFGCIQFTFSVLNFVSPPQREVSSEGSTSASMNIDGKGSIPQRILKRERDSTSSSTLTVSTTKKQGDEYEEEDDDKDDENDDENDDESDREETCEEMDEDKSDVMNEDTEMQEPSIEIKQEHELFPSDSNCIENSCGLDGPNVV